jgi:hypothetical protein
MRGGPLEDPETGETVIDPITNKAYMIPPRGVTAWDIVKKFDRDMPLDQAITYLRVLSENDRLITSSEIADEDCSGVDSLYHYKDKKRKRTRGE